MYTSRCAAQNPRTVYTLITSAERHGLDPQRYLTSVLAKIGQTPLSELEQFLPEAWKREDVSDGLPHLTHTSPTKPA